MQIAQRQTVNGSQEKPVEQKRPEQQGSPEPPQWTHLLLAQA
jgi:hypothetical protein